MILPITDYDRELMGWVEMIVMKKWPLTAVEDPLYYRKIMKHTAHQCLFLCNGVCCHSWHVCCVGERNCFGDDGSRLWETYPRCMDYKFGIHYLAIFASYIVEKEFWDPRGKKTLMAKEPKIVLLSVAPLHKVKTKKRHR
jgi:hypothetical protein